MRKHRYKLCSTNMCLYYCTQLQPLLLITTKEQTSKQQQQDNGQTLEYPMVIL